MKTTKIKTKKVSPGHYEYKEWKILKDGENEDVGYLWYADHPNLGEYWARTKASILEIIKEVEDRNASWVIETLLIWADPGQTNP